MLHDPRPHAREDDSDDDDDDHDNNDASSNDMHITKRLDATVLTRVTLVFLHKRRQNLERIFASNWLSRLGSD